MVQPPSTPPTAVALEQLQKAAYQEGYEAGRKEGFEFGHKEGLEQARKDLQHYANQFERLLQTFEQPLRELDNQVERELLSLVIATVRQLVRREVKSDPSLIIGVVREALSWRVSLHRCWRVLGQSMIQKMRTSIGHATR
ncbi:MAG: FliH/SctL family protein [Candidatus Thiodiazotropha sp.]